MQIETQIILLLSIASLIAVLARRVRVPYTIAMVLTGVAVSIFVAPFLEVPTIKLTRHLILVTFLPGLLFEAAFHLDLRELKDNTRAISVLAVPGVLLSTAVVTLIIVALTELRFETALLFGALISATDPIAVLAIFKNLGVPKRLGIIIEGESLFNDGTALVIFEIVLGIVLGHMEFTVVSSVQQFFVVVAGGIVLGLVMGLIFTQLMRHTADPLVDMALTMVLAYGAFLIGEELGVSSVIAVVAAGMYVGNFATRGGLSATTRLTLASFWEYLTFLINSAIFLLIGLEVKISGLLDNGLLIGVGIAAMLVARLVVIYPLGFLANLRSRRGLPTRWVHVMFWGGLRGSVSLALAISLPPDLEDAELIQIMAFGAVFFSLVVQGLTISPLLKRLDIGKSSEHQTQYQRLSARWAIAHTALQAVENLHEERVVSGQVRDQLKRIFEKSSGEAWSRLELLIAASPEVLQSEVQFVRREIADEQKVTLRNMLQRGTISDEIYYELNSEINDQISKSDKEDWQLSQKRMRLGEGHSEQENA